MLQNIENNLKMTKALPGKAVWFMALLMVCSGFLMAALAVNAASNLAVMVRPVDGAAELGVFLADRRLNAVAMGPAPFRPVGS